MTIVDDVTATRPSLFLASRMKRLAERFQADAMILLKAANLPIQPSNVLLLAVLYERGPQTITGLATALRLAQPTVTQAVAGLVDTGLLSLSRGEFDQRQRTAALTEAGRAMWERAEREIWTPLERAVRAMLAGMDNDLLAGLHEVETLLAQRPTHERVRAGDGAEPAQLEAAPLGDAAVPTDEHRPARAGYPVLRWASSPDDFAAALLMLREHIDAIHMPEAASYLDVTAVSVAQTYSSRWARLLLAEIDAKPVGMFAFKPFDDSRAKLNYFYVRPAARGLGLGRALIATVLREAKASGYAGALLSTLPRWKAARAIYTSFGFARTVPLYPDLPGAEYYQLSL